MILHFFIIIFVTSLLAFVFSQLNVQKTNDFELLSAYECGFNPFSDTRSAFDVKFYLVAIFFIIFDLEIIFFFPFVIYVLNLSIFQFSIMCFFIFQLFLGLVYEYFSGTLEWLIMIFTIFNILKNRKLAFSNEYTILQLLLYKF